MSLKLATQREFAAEQIDTADNDQVIQSVVKSLDVLEHVSALGIATVGQLSIDCHLPKATVVRLLQTLIICGYVRQVSPRAGYCLTSRLNTIGSGFSGVASLLEAGIPLTDAMTDEIDWPVALATLDGVDCVVRYSTIPKSPYAHARSTIGKRLPLSSSAHGKAMLAALQPARRAVLLDSLRVDEKQDGVDDGALHLIQKRGYAVRTPGRDPTTNTIAAPIIVSGVVAGTIGVTFFAGAVRSDSFPMLGMKLTEAASAIATRVVDKANADETKLPLLQ